MASSFFRIVWGQQDLRHGDAVAGERLLVGVSEADLSGSCGGLLFLEPEPPAGEAEMPPAHRDRPGRHQDHLLPARSTAGNVIGERSEPWPAHLAVFGG
jgi:hypothetical protein